MLGLDLTVDVWRKKGVVVANLGSCTISGCGPSVCREGLDWRAVVFGSHEGLLLYYFEATPKIHMQMLWLLTKIQCTVSLLLSACRTIPFFAYFGYS